MPTIKSRPTDRNEAGIPVYRAHVIRVREQGSRVINGTAWSISSHVERVTYDGRTVEWAVIWNLCNGVPSGRTVCRTRREAIALLGDA
jgi:hypothetical protein